MYQRILCPIDGSTTSNRGMLEAIDLAKNQNAKLRFVHIVDTYVPIMSGEGSLIPVDISDILQKNAKEVVEKANAEARKAGVEADTKIIETLGGRPSQAIVKQAEEWAASLIVMGTHGLRGLNRMVMGSDAENVLRASSVPVLLVKAA